MAALTVTLAAAGGWFAWRWQARGPDEASVSDAVDRFRSSSTVPRPALGLRPPAGVYTYAGSGEEHLSFLSTSQTQGPTIPGTVTHTTGGCWTFAVEYNTFHRQTWEWCARGDRLLESGGTTRQQFDFVAFTVDEHSEVVCDPPFALADREARAGAVVSTRCETHSDTTGTDMVSTGTVRFVGRETVDVGGAAVPALHYRADRTFTGDQTGRERTDLWLAERDGLPLRNTRDIQVVSPAPAPLDEVTYSERGEFHLTSLRPQV